MNHRTGLDRSQTLLFPERLEDYIGPETPVRFLDAFVGSLDLHALGFARARCADTGNGSITAENGLLVLHFREAPAKGVIFNLYRDGQLCAKDIVSNEWTDSGAADYTNTVHFYVAEALDKSTGNTSHLSPSRSFLTADNSWQPDCHERQSPRGLERFFSFSRTASCH